MATALFFLVTVLFSVALSTTRPTVVITGGNSGIGFHAARQLAASNAWQIVLACRSQDKGERARSRMPNPDNIEVKQLDLADLASVSRFCDEWGPTRPLHCLALNAGIQKSKRALGGESIDCALIPRTAQGFEETIGVNHIGHFALAQRLVGNLRLAGGRGRIVWTGSGVHDPTAAGGNVGSGATLGDMSGLEEMLSGGGCMVDAAGRMYDPDKSYKDSKLMNTMTSLEMARRLGAGNGITVNVFNPGLCPQTGLFRDLNPVFVAVFTVMTRYVARVASSVEDGGARLAYMIDSPTLEGVTGAYLTGKVLKLATPSEEARDEVKAKQLYDMTERLIARAGFR